MIDTPSDNVFDSLVFTVARTFGPEVSLHPIGAAARMAPQRDSSLLLAGSRMALTGVSGNVYLLDPAANQIFVYDSTGVPLGAMGALGEGPGEMAGPLAIDVSPANRLGLVDIQLRRVSVFEPDGSLAASLPIRRNGAALVLHEHGFDVLTDFGPSSEGAVLRFDREGKLLAELVVPTAEEGAFAQTGMIGWLARGFHDHESLFFSGNPGVFARIDSDGNVSNRLGAPIFIENRAMALDNGERVPLRYAPAGTRAGGVLSNGRGMFVAYYCCLIASGRQLAQDSVRWGIAVLDSTGHLLARGSTPKDWGSLHGVTPGPDNSLYLALTEPVPHVKQVRLTRVARGGAPTTSGSDEN